MLRSWVAYRLYLLHQYNALDSLRRWVFSQRVNKKVIRKHEPTCWVSLLFKSRLDAISSHEISTAAQYSTFLPVKILHLGSAKECKSFFGTFILHPMLYVLVPSCHEDTNPTEHMMARCLLRAIPQNWTWNAWFQFNFSFIFTARQGNCHY